MQTEERVQIIFADLIDEPTLAMRTEIPREELWELADDIKVNGLINPITVRPSGERFEIVAGHRRFLACRIAGVLRIQCIVRDVKDSALLSIMASENLARSDVDPVDEANFIARMMSEKNMTAAEVARTIRRSPSYVAGRLVVGSMPQYMQNYIKSGEIKLGVALHLVQIEPDEKRRVWVGLAVQDSITERTAEYWAYQHKLGTLPEIVVSQDDIPEAERVEFKIPTFICAIDGKPHPTTELRCISIAAPNMQALHEFSSAFREDFAGTELPPETDTAEAPVGAPASMT